MGGKTRREINRDPKNGNNWLMSTIIWGFIFLLALLVATKKLQDHFENKLLDFQLNVSTEVLGVVAGAGISALVIDRVYAYRNRKDLQRRLIREAGSLSHDVAISAVEWLDREWWLTGAEGLLKGAILRDARLQEARLDASES